MINCYHRDSGRLNGLYIIGDTVSFQCGITKKEGVILVVDAYDAFKCQGLHTTK